MQITKIVVLLGICALLSLPIPQTKRDSGCLYADTLYNFNIQRVNGGHCQVCRADSSWGDLPPGNCPDCSRQSDNPKHVGNDEAKPKTPAAPALKNVTKPNICQDDQARAYDLLALRINSDGACQRCVLASNPQFPGEATFQNATAVLCQDCKTPK